MIFTFAGGNDVLLGQGAHGNRHRGNRAWRDRVRSWKPRYKRASDMKSGNRECKLEVSQALVRQWYDEGGHFLEKREDGYYADIGFGRAVRKTSQRFRDTSKKKKRASANVQPAEAHFLGDTEDDDDDKRKHSSMPIATTSVETSEEDVDNTFAASTLVVDDPPLYSNGHFETVPDNNTAPDIPAAPVYADAHVLVASSSEPHPIASPFDQEDFGVFSFPPAATTSELVALPSPTGFDQTESMPIALEVDNQQEVFHDGYNGKTNGNATGTHESIENKKWCSNTEESEKDVVVVTATEVSRCEDATNGPSSSSFFEVSSSPLENEFRNKTDHPSAVAVNPTLVTPFVSSAPPPAGLQQEGADSENGGLVASSERRKFGQVVEEHQHFFSTDRPIRKKQPRASRSIRSIAALQQIAEDSANGIYNLRTFKW